MTGKIFKKYFLMFDGKITFESVILLIYEFSVYHAELNLLQQKFSQGLTNTEIKFFLS